MSEAWRVSKPNCITFNLALFKLRPRGARPTIQSAVAKKEEKASTFVTFPAGLPKGNSSCVQVRGSLAGFFAMWLLQRCGTQFDSHCSHRNPCGMESLPPSPALIRGITATSVFWLKVSANDEWSKGPSTALFLRAACAAVANSRDWIPKHCKTL